MTDTNFSITESPAGWIKDRGTLVQHPVEGILRLDGTTLSFRSLDDKDVLDVAVNNIKRVNRQGSLGWPYQFDIILSKEGRVQYGTSIVSFTLDSSTLDQKLMNTWSSAFHSLGKRNTSVIGNRLVIILFIALLATILLVSRG